MSTEQAIMVVFAGWLVAMLLGAWVISACPRTWGDFFQSSKWDFRRIFR